MENGWTPGMTLDYVEKEVITKAFRWFRYNKTQTAIALGISIRTLENKLERYEREKSGHRIGEREGDADKLEDAGPGNAGEPKRQSDFTGEIAEAGLRIQPLTDDTAKQSVPLSQRKEVQEVSSPNASRGHSKRGR